MFYVIQNYPDCKAIVLLSSLPSTTNDYLLQHVFGLDLLLAVNDLPRRPGHCHVSPVSDPTDNHTHVNELGETVVHAGLNSGFYVIETELELNVEGHVSESSVNVVYHEVNSDWDTLANDGGLWTQAQGYLDDLNDVLDESVTTLDQAFDFPEVALITLITLIESTL